MNTDRIVESQFFSYGEMMTKKSTDVARLRSWIPAQFEWTVSSGLFGCRIPANSADLVAALAEGSIQVKAESSAVAESAACGSRLSMRYLEEACYRWLVQCQGPWDEMVKGFFLCDVFSLSSEELFVVIADSPDAVPMSPTRSKLEQNASDRMERFEREGEDHRKELEERRADIEHDPNLADEVRRIMIATFDTYGAPPPPGIPRLSDLSFLPEYVSLVSPFPSAERKRRDALLKSVNASGRAPSRDGAYQCVSLPMVDGSEAA